MNHIHLLWGSYEVIVYQLNSFDWFPEDQKRHQPDQSGSSVEAHPREPPPQGQGHAEQEQVCGSVLAR